MDETNFDNELSNLKIKEEEVKGRGIRIMQISCFCTCKKVDVGRPCSIHYETVNAVSKDAIPGE